MSKETSPEIATKASEVLRDADKIETFLANAKSVAASALSQREPDRTEFMVHALGILTGGLLEISNFPRSKCYIHEEADAIRKVASDTLERAEAVLKGERW